MADCSPDVPPADPPDALRDRATAPPKTRDAAGRFAPGESSRERERAAAAARQRLKREVDALTAGYAGRHAPLVRHAARALVRIGQVIEQAEEELLSAKGPRKAQLQQLVVNAGRPLASELRQLFGALMDARGGGGRQRLVVEVVSGGTVEGVALDDWNAAEGATPSTSAPEPTAQQSEPSRPAEPSARAQAERGGAAGDPAAVPELRELLERPHRVEAEPRGPKRVEPGDRLDRRVVQELRDGPSGPSAQRW